MKGTVLLFCLLGVASGCNRYAMQDIKIVNPKVTGPDVVVVCDTCHEQSPCGDRDSTLVWANDHAKSHASWGKSEHTAFHRAPCSTGLKPVPKYTPDEDRANNPFLKQPPVAQTKPSTPLPGKGELAVGMTLKQARDTMGTIGVTESETVDERVVRFEQINLVEGKTATRSLHARFKSGTLVEVTSDPWR